MVSDFSYLLKLNWKRDKVKDVTEMQSTGPSSHGPNNAVLRIPAGKLKLELVGTGLL